MLRTCRDLLAVYDRIAGDERLLKEARKINLLIDLASLFEMKPVSQQIDCANAIRRWLPEAIPFLSSIVGSLVAERQFRVADNTLERAFRSYPKETDLPAKVASIGLEHMNSCIACGDLAIAGNFIARAYYNAQPLSPQRAQLAGIGLQLVTNCLASNHFALADGLLEWACDSLLDSSDRITYIKIRLSIVDKCLKVGDDATAAKVLYRIHGYCSPQELRLCSVLRRTLTIIDDCIEEKRLDTAHTLLEHAANYSCSAVSVDSIEIKRRIKMLAECRIALRLGSQLNISSVKQIATDALHGHSHRMRIAFSDPITIPNHGAAGIQAVHPALQQ